MNQELLNKARAAKSPEELLRLAQENGIDLTEESAKSYFELVHKPGELTDEELENAAGGSCGTPKVNCETLRMVEAKRCAWRAHSSAELAYNGWSRWACKKCGNAVHFLDNGYEACSHVHKFSTLDCSNCKWSLY